MLCSSIWPNGNSCGVCSAAGSGSSVANRPSAVRTPTAAVCVGIGPMCPRVQGALANAPALGETWPQVLSTSSKTVSIPRSGIAAIFNGA